MFSRLFVIALILNMYRMVKIFWLGKVVYPRTISPEPEKYR